MIIESVWSYTHNYIFQLQSCPYDPKYIDLYRVNNNLPH